MATLSNKRVLVTGGCGFIGTNLTQELLAEGAKVTVLDLPEGHWERIPKPASQIKADILDKKALKGKLKYFDVIYHLAARPDLDGKTLADYKTNFEGTKNLLVEIAGSSRKPKFIFYSTQLVVGLFDETRFIDAGEPYRTKTIYGQSKIEGEKVVKKYCTKYDIPYTIIRPTSVYGPWGEEPYKNFFKTIKSGRYFHVGKASNLVSWVYVKNLIDFTILCSLSDKTNNRIFYGNDFHPYTMRQIVDTVAEYYKIRVRTIPSGLMAAVAYCLAPLKAMGINVPIYPFRLRNIKANYCYDIEDCVKVGYAPQYSLREGIQETLDWYEARDYKT